MAVLYHYAFGAGRPVIALHGITAHGARWRRLAERHLDGIQLVGFDLRGHGRSPWTPPWTLEQNVTDVLDTMDSLGLDTVDIIGHSFGGAVALRTAVAAPDRVRRLVLLDPALSLHPEYVLKRATAELTPPVFADPSEARLERLAHWPRAEDPTVADDEVADHLVEGEDGLWHWRVAAPAVVTAFSEMTRTPPLPPPTVPTLIVVASEGTAVGRPYLDALAAAEGLDVKVTEIDASHSVYIDRPAETAALIQTHLS